MFSQTVEYALRVAVCLAESDPRPRTADDLSRVTHVPRAYLAKVIQAMVRGGAARSKRGVGGGVTLAKPAEELTLLDVVNSVDSMKRLNHIRTSEQSRGAGLERLHRRCEKAIIAMESVLGEVSLAELVADQRASGGDSRAADAGAEAGDRAAVEGENFREAGPHTGIDASTRNPAASQSPASHNGNRTPMGGVGEPTAASPIGAR